MSSREYGLWSVAAPMHTQQHACTSSPCAPAFGQAGRCTEARLPAGACPATPWRRTWCQPQAQTAASLCVRMPGLPRAHANAPPAWLVHTQVLLRPTLHRQTLLMPLPRFAAAPTLRWPSAPPTRRTAWPPPRAWAYHACRTPRPCPRTSCLAAACASAMSAATLATTRSHISWATVRVWVYKRVCVHVRVYVHCAQVHSVRARMHLGHSLFPDPACR